MCARRAAQRHSLPCRNTVTYDILPLVTEETTAKLNEAMEQHAVYGRTLQTDGWKLSVKKQSYLNTALPPAASPSCSPPT